MERPSMCGGASTPAMSRNVGARSMLRTISSTLRDRQIGIRSTGPPISLHNALASSSMPLASYTVPGSTPGPRTRNGTRTSNSNGKDFPLTRPNWPRW